MKWRNLRKREKSRKASKNPDTAVVPGLCSAASNASEIIRAGHPEGVWVSEELTK
jgi:hypothetical protein